MTQTKRAQVLMEPGEYRRLERIARRQGVSVAELIRSAVRERYLLTAEERAARVEAILRMNVPVGDWNEVEAVILEEHGHGLS